MKYKKSIKKHWLIYFGPAIVILFSGIFTYQFLIFDRKESLQDEGVTNRSIIGTSGRNVKTINPTNSPSISPTPTPDPYAGMDPEFFYITYYGWPDNSPPGRAIAYPKVQYPSTLHNEAGGIGTFNDPLTYAASESTIPIGTIYYVPYLKKYIVLEDICANCMEDHHIDIWLESNDAFEEEVLKCQRNFTRSKTLVVTNPSINLPVDTRPLFDLNDGDCLIH